MLIPFKIRALFIWTDPSLPDLLCIRFLFVDLIWVFFLRRDWSPKFETPMSTSFWQKKRLVTLILFDLCLFKHFSLSQIVVISLYVQNMAKIELLDLHLHIRCENGDPLLGNLLLEWKANLSCDWKFKTVLCHLLDNFGWIILHHWHTHGFILFTNLLVFHCQYISRKTLKFC